MIHLVAAITWTPLTFYVAMGILHSILILIGYRLLHVDPEHNTFIGAILAAAAINVIGYFVRDLGIVAVMIQIALVFGALVMIASGEALKAALMAVVLLASYGLAGQLLIPRTPLNQKQIGGIGAVILSGGLKEEAMTENDVKSLNEKGLPVFEQREVDTP